MNDSTPTLEVGFLVETGDSYEALLQLQAIMTSTEGKLVAEAAKIERATGNMVQLGPATARITTFGAATTREQQNIRNEINRTERSIERLIKSIDREAEAVGRTREEQRAAKVETLAVTAAQQGNTDAADRLHASYRKLEQAQAALAETRLAEETKRQTEALLERERAESALYGRLLERSRLEAAIARIDGSDRPTAAQGGATYSALAAKAAEDEARAQKLAAESTDRLAREHQALAERVRASHDAQIADAAAAERLRETTDPLYAAVKRLNAQVAESTRLYHNGATAPAEYARQQEVLARQLKATTEQHEALAIAGGKSAGAMRNLVIQLPDITQGLLTGQKPFTILIQQGGQLAQVALLAEGGLKAMAAAIGTVSLYLAPFAVIGGLAYAAIAKFQGEVAKDGELTRYRNSLGLTHNEMLRLSDGVEKVGGDIKGLTDVTVTFGDVMSGVWKTISDQLDASDSWAQFKAGASDSTGFAIDAFRTFGLTINSINDTAFDAVIRIWKSLPAIFSETFVNAANLAIAALNGLVKAGADQLNKYIATVNLIPGVKIGALSAPEIKPIDNPNAGALNKTLGAIYADYDAIYAARDKGNKSLLAQFSDNAKKFAKARQDAEAEAIKAGRTPPKPKVDRNALNAEAIDAQIRNLYKLADAYRVSGAEALIAEAREKAESKAIRARGDVDAEVARQIRLTIAQRVADAAKATAGVRDQADAQAQVNAMVAAGLVPAERAAELVRDRIADLPLLAAIEAAQKTKDIEGIKQATAALEEQRAARDKLAKAEADARYNAALSAGQKQLDQLREELRLIGATDEARARSLAEFRARQEAAALNITDGDKLAAYVKLQGDLAAQGVLNTQAQNAYNAALTETADRWDIIASKVQSAAQGLSDAFGSVGKAIGDVATIYASFEAQRSRALAEHDAAIRAAGSNEKLIAQENSRFALRSSGAQIAMYGDLASAAKGFFSEGSKGYKALETAEKAFRAVQFVLSVKAIAQDAIETGSSIANSVLRAGKYAVEAVAKAIASLPFPLNLAAGAATAAALASIGLSIGGSFGGKNTLAKANDGTGTVLGDPSAKSESIKNAIDALKQVDSVMLTYSRQMADSLKSIDSQIGGVASLVSRAGNVNADNLVATGFKPNLIGSVLGSIPLIGGILGSLFGSKTEVIGSGIYGGSQSLGNILSNGFDASYYSDIKKTSKFFGFTTGTKYSTKYTAADAALENQFTLILKSFNDAIVAAAGPLGAATDDIQNRLNSFVVNIGKIDLKGLTGSEIQDKLNAVFGAAADGLAAAAFPEIQQFQKVGEGAFETLVRVSSTVESVTAALDQLGGSTQNLSIAAKLGLADQFGSISDLNSAVSGYFEAYYTKEEQAAAQTAQFTKVFDSLGLVMPNTLAAFRALVEAQDLTTAAGQATYATLLQLAPAFADLQNSLEGAKSAADIASERNDLQRQLLQLQGDTAALRALDLAKIDPSNRALQQQVWALADAQDAAKNAQELADAWTNVGNSIMDEVKRIRGLSDANSSGGFAQLLGQFNAANTAARLGDQEAAKSLPGLSQALLNAAANAATSKQELDRIRAQTAAALEATYGAITALTKGASTTDASGTTTPTAAINAPQTSNDNTASSIGQLSDELASTRADLTLVMAQIAANTGKMAKKLDDVTAQSGGDAISTVAAA